MHAGALHIADQFRKSVAYNGPCTTRDESTYITAVQYVRPGQTYLLPPRLTALSVASLCIAPTAINANLPDGQMNQDAHSSVVGVT